MQRCSLLLKIRAVIFLILFFYPASAQQKNAVLLKITRKNSHFHPGKTDYQPGKKGFYLYENCNYDIMLKDESIYIAKIIQVKKDSIRFSYNGGKTDPSGNHELTDTVTIPASSLRKIFLVGDRIFGLYTKVRLKNYRFEFIEDSLPKRFPEETYTDCNSSETYKITYSMSAQGADKIYELVEKPGPGKKEPKTDTAAVDSIYRKRNIAWFLPFKANEINGLALGLQTCNADFNELKIRGVNANVDVLSTMLSMFYMFRVFDAASVKNLKDTADYTCNVSITGLGLSLGGVISGKNLNGLFINGGICESAIARGLFISGVNNDFNNLKGISIGGLRNTAVKCTGIQIGLINSCKHLKGLQIGLWNVNSKRKWPIINWGL